MMVERVNRAALVLGLGALASWVLALVDLVDPADPTQYQLVRLHWPAWAVLLVLGVLAVAGGRLGRRGLVAAAGAGFGLAAVVQLVQLGRGTNWLHGDGSTMSLFLGFGIGLLVLGLTPIPDVPDPNPTTEGTDRAG